MAKIRNTDTSQYELTVIIVNYNVMYFLEQCLLSVRRASVELKVQIFVVDNASTDGSKRMVRRKFPEVKLIENRENLGFSKANNLAIQRAEGRYILLLNPDTLVEEDTFAKVIHFMDTHPDAGALGVKMVDGSGQFLPESKRGLPTPAVAFYKLLGLSNLFPASPRFGRYHLSYLSPDDIHQVEVLSGAFLLVRREVIDKIGMLDEDFFMYGEDIDFSYRIIQAGYKNYYFPHTRIIHYKGESTRKGSLNYVFVFYNAMKIFARKHFSSSQAGFFNVIITLAIYIRAFIALGEQFLSRFFLPLLDYTVIFLGLRYATHLWEQTKATSSAYYPSIFHHWVLPIYVGIWVVSVAFSGGYAVPLSMRKMRRGLLWGTVAILLGYALLPEQYRFSRAIILMGAFWAVTVMSSLRLLLHSLKFERYQLGDSREKRFIVVGSPQEALRIKKLLQQTVNPLHFCGIVLVPDENASNDHNGASIPFSAGESPFLGSFSGLKELVRAYRISEIVFCAKDLSAPKIIDSMSELSELEVKFKIAPPDGMFIIGSNSSRVPGEFYAVELNSIASSTNRRKKRLFDILSSLIILPLSPLLAAIYRVSFRQFMRHTLLVLTGRCTWVGYSAPLFAQRVAQDNGEEPPVPRESLSETALKPGVLCEADLYREEQLTLEVIRKLDMMYSKDYSLRKDMIILLRALKKAGTMRIRN